MAARKTKKTLEEMNLNELFEIKSFVKDLVNEYDTNLHTYSMLNGDMTYERMGESEKLCFDKKRELNLLLFKINGLAEKLIFNEYIKKDM